MRLRKNINCLSTNELHDLREAFQGIYDLPASNPRSFVTIAGLHGNPSPSYCIHGNTGFLTWHRAYLMEIENALRSIHCDVALPYWNWSSGDTTGLPDACSHATYVNRNGDTVPNPLYRGPKPASAGGGQTSRRGDIDTTSFDDLAEDAQGAMANTVWNDFVSALNGVHGSVHVRIGGDMSSVPTAGFDPIFFFHHANVDRLWANWIAANPQSLPASEANAQLEPFTKPYSSDWHTGSDFETTTTWDYQYRNWCIFIPPIFWPIEWKFKIPFEPWVSLSRRIALTAKAPMMPRHSFELRVFIDSPKATDKTKTKDNPNFAGSIGVFGMGDAQMYMRPKQGFEVSLDITRSLRHCLSKKSKESLIKLVPVFPKGQEISEKEMSKLQIELEVQ
ncbi:MAG: tyrosinase family protein [Bacteroidetes bacterium]|nr:tyrosinase family protein [Bacteroidota bacterium]